MRKSSLVITSVVIAVVVSASVLSASSLAAGKSAKANFITTEESVIVSAKSDEAIDDEVEVLIVEPAEEVYEEETPAVIPAASRIQAEIVEVEELIEVKQDEPEEEIPEFGSAMRYNPSTGCYETTDGESWPADEDGTDEIGLAIWYNPSTGCYETSEGESWPAAEAEEADPVERPEAEAEEADPVESKEEEEVGPMIPAETPNYEEEVGPVLPPVTDGDYEEVAPLIPPAVNEAEQGVTIPPAVYNPDEATATDATTE